MHSIPWHINNQITSRRMQTAASMARTILTWRHHLSLGLWGLDLILEDVSEESVDRLCSGVSISVATTASSFFFLFLSCLVGLARRGALVEVPASAAAPFMGGQAGGWGSRSKEATRRRTMGAKWSSRRLGLAVAERMLVNSSLKL